MRPMAQRAKISRNRIAFEGLASCGCGNEQSHRDAAVSAWVDAVTEFLDFRGLHNVCVEIRYGTNPNELRFGPLPPAVIDAADRADMRAAQAAFEADCSGLI